MAAPTATPITRGKPATNGKPPTAATKPAAAAAAKPATPPAKGPKKARTPEQLAAMAERRTYSAKRALATITGLTAPEQKSKRTNFPDAMTPAGKLHGVNWDKMGAPQARQLLADFQAKMSEILGPIAEAQAKSSSTGAVKLAVGDTVYIRPDSLKFVPGSTAETKYKVIALYSVPQGKGSSLSAIVLSDTGDKDRIPVRYLMAASSDGSKPTAPVTSLTDDEDDDEDEDDQD